MAKIREYQKSKIRFQKGGLILFEPNEEQREYILNIIKNNSTMDNGLNTETEFEIEVFRGILKTLTNLEDVDYLSDEELVRLTSETNANRDLSLLVRSTRDLIQELIEDVQYEQFKMIDTAIAMIKAIEGVEKTNKATDMLNKTLKKQGLATLDEINAVKDNPEELEKLLKAKSKGKGKKKTSPKKK